MNLLDAIARRLGDGPATVEEIVVALGQSASTVRNTLARMYFAGDVGCDPKRRYHLVEGAQLSNGVPVIRHLDGRDVFA